MARTAQASARHRATVAAAAFAAALTSLPGAAVAGPGRTTAPAEPVTWTAPVAVSDTTVHAIGPSTSQSTDGTVTVAVWEQHGGGGGPFEVWAAVRTSGPGGPWEPPQRLSVGDLDVIGPMVEVTADGASATAVWATRDPDRYVGTGYMASTWTIDGWQPPVTIPGTGGLDGNPLLAASSDGRVVAVAWVRSPARFGVQVEAVIRLDGTWQPPAPVSPVVPVSPVDYAGPPSLAVSGDGTLVVLAWAAVRPDNRATVDAATFDGRVWSAPRRLAAGTGIDQPAVTMTERRVLAVWPQARRGTATVRASTFTGRWGKARTAAIIPGQSVTAIDVAATADAGTVTVVGAALDGRGRARPFALDRRNNRWSKPAILSRNGYSPSIAMTGDGARTVVSWDAAQRRSPMGTCRVRAVSRTGGRAWPQPVTVSNAGTFTLGDFYGSPCAPQTLLAAPPTGSGEVTVVYAWPTRESRSTITAVTGA